MKSTGNKYSEFLKFIVVLIVLLLYNSFNKKQLLYIKKEGTKMISEKERQNMIQFLVLYFQSDPNQLNNLTDSSLESTYEFAYSRTLMECDF